LRAGLTKAAFSSVLQWAGNVRGAKSVATIAVAIRTVVIVEGS